MQNRSTMILLLITLILLTSDSFPQGKKRTLLAAPYPGSVAESYAAENTPVPAVPLESRMQVFYSKDPAEKVKASYSKNLGKWEETFESTPGQYAAVVPAMELRETLLKRGLELGEAGWSIDIRGDRAGVTIYGKPGSYNVNVVTVLDKLKNAWLLRFMGAEGEDGATLSKHLEDPEFTKTLAKYEHIQWEYFPLEKDRRMDEVLVEKHYTIPEKALQEEQTALSQKMMDLTTAGKFDEAAKVSDRMMAISSRPTDAKANWDVAVQCLEEMAAHSFPTKIVIDRPPAEWEFPGGGGN